MANEIKKKITDEYRIIGDHQQFEQLISDTAAKIAQIGPEKLEETIDAILRSLGQFFHAKLAFLGQFTEDSKKLNFTNIWVPEGIRPASCNSKIKTTLEAHVSRQHPLNGEIVNMEPEFAGLPDKDRLDRLLEDSGMQSSIVVPICVQDRSIGLLGLGAFSKPLEYPLVTGDRLQIIADVIGSMLIRIQQRSLIMNKRRR